METGSHPVQVLSLCNADGQLQPLRFRFEDEAHQLHTVQVTEVLDTRKVSHVGIDMLSFLCRAEADGMRQLFELRYAIRAHRWHLARRLY